MVCCRERLRLIAAAFVIWAIACVGAMAQPPLTITTSGYYLTVVDADGIPQLVKITTVVDLTGGDGTPAPPIDDSNLDIELVKQVKQWSLAIEDPQSAQAIAWVYLQLADALDDDLLDTTSIWLATKTATDSAIGVVEGSKDWKPFRDQLSDVITIGRQRGTMQSKAAIGRMMRSVQKGLEQAADGSNALTMAQTAAITAKTNEAIDAAK